jgi:hypothetical protein
MRSIGESDANSRLPESAARSPSTRDVHKPTASGMVPENSVDPRLILRSALHAETDDASVPDTAVR